MFDDVTSVALKVALDGLAVRQRTTADNVANIETPGFLAGRVDFESSLAQAIQDGGNVSAVTPTMSRSMDPTRTDGNNVNLDDETLLDEKTQMAYQLVLRAASDQMGFLRTALKTS
jgi:flagellar basal-body rod protein FlgB